MKLKEIPLSIYQSGLTEYKYARLQTPFTPTLDFEEVIISLTSIASRLPTLHLTIKSLLLQETKPSKIILWLEKGLEASIPNNLNKLKSEYFDIQFRAGSSSHRKLVFSLELFTDTVIITCDDDVIYRPNWLSSLLKNHKKYPTSIVAHECREIISDISGNLASYANWPTITATNHKTNKLLPIGYGGILYPPHSLHSDVTNQDLFLKLAPKADDLWFRAMALLNNTNVMKSDHPCNKPIPIIGAKGNSLATTNIDEDGNRKQWLAICAYYQINPCSLKLQS